MIPVVYGELCPICRGDLTWEEIENGRCFHRNTPLNKNYLEERYKKFEEFFLKTFGSRPRAMQRMWARRVLSGDSFAAIAPTGIGKSLFGIMMAAYLASEGKKAYIIVPTTLILKEFVEKLHSLGVDDFAHYHGRMRRGEKEEMENRIKRGDFKILITTTAYLARRYATLRGKRFHFVFVDDVDSLLKGSRNLEKVLGIMHRNGILMVSTATGTRGYNTKILRERLNFDVGNIRNAVRNVDDIAAPKERLEYILNVMGPGALIFAPTAQEAREMASLIPRSGLVLAESKESYERFREGELDFLVGVATPYGSLIRGLDMPERVRYVIFYGIPRFKIGLNDVDALGERMLITVAHLLQEKSPLLREAIEKNDIDAIRGEIKKILQRGALQGRGFVYRNGHIIFPDLKTYIQGSGRASRLYAGGLTKGASFVLDDPDLLEILSARAEIYGIEFSPIDEIDLEKLREEIDRDRKKVRVRGYESEIIRPALFVVESPNKARHIAHFFGKPNLRIIGNAIVYEVAIGNRVLTIAPSLGHTVDLTTSRGYHGVEVGKHFVPIYAPIRKCRDCGYQFTEGAKCPVCGSKNIYHAGMQIEVLRKLAQECEEVIVGTDPDTEGEKIAWDLRNLLAPFAKSIKRAEFHEVTKKAIIRATENMRDFNENLVKAQIVRRIEDRWIGFELSHILWREFGERNLSAGRAQTPVLGWVIERYDKSKEVRVEYFLRGTDVKVPWTRDVLGVVERIGEVVKKYVVSPYTTDEVLKDANTILNLGAGESMRILQELFEMGLITYHRTDSTHVSPEGMKIARKYLGEDFRGRSWGKEGAHECIRPTRALSSEDLKRYVKEGVFTYKLDEDHVAIYDLIFRRFMASQSDGEIRIIRYRISAENREIEFPLIVDARGTSVELYPFRVKKYPPLSEGRVKIEVEGRKIKLRPYTQADLIRLMRDRGIGRPSTYATIISKLFLRRYVIERNGLIPTRRGRQVYEFLRDNYGEFISEERTRNLERKMDDVESGRRDYEELLGELYREMQTLSTGK